MVVFVEGLQVFVSLLFLFYASWSDLKTREVSNWVWVFFAPIGAALSLILLYLFDFSYDMLYVFGISIGVVSALAVALFYAGAFGGADAKALICISLTLPFYPSDFIRLTSTTLVFPLSVFSNAIILAALSVLYALFRNAFWRQKTHKRLFENLERESKGRKILALLSGYKIPMDKLEKSSFLYPLEDVEVSEEGETIRKLIVFPKDEEREEIVNRILAAAKEEKTEYVWATPGLPMLVFITAGLITALVFGDFVWIVLSRLLA